MLLLILVLVLVTPVFLAASFVALDPTTYRQHFKEGWPGPYDDGSGVGVVNESSYAWSVDNLPLFDASDNDLVSAYYYRAKSYKSHMMRTDWVDIRHVSSEFGPTVPWGGVYGTINAAAGHHISEGRWIRDRNYTAGLVRFWIGSQAGGTLPRAHQQQGNSGAFEPGVGHFANGSKGQIGPCAYSSWILSASLKAAAVQGDLQLGRDFKGGEVTFLDMLPLMVAWWETRSLQLRMDCVVANGDRQMNPQDMDPACLDTPPQPGSPYCYAIADGWDAMEGSVSGNGCRPTIGSMMWSEALAIAAVANSTGGNKTLARQFEQRASWIRDWYLANLWSDEAQWLGVYKSGAAFHTMGGCTESTLHNKTDSGCCCVKAGSPFQADPHYKNFSACPNGPPWPHPSPGNNSVCRSLDSLQTGGPERHSSAWPCGQPTTVRELLGLGSAYYFGITPRDSGGCTKFDGMWKDLFDGVGGFWGTYGPTTVERRNTCFNWTQDTAECNWAGPSWPYETSRVLTGLSNFLTQYPASQAAAAGMTPAHYTKLLRTYARSMTTGQATNGSVPWVGENIEPDKGFWIAHSIQYRGGPGTIDLDRPWLPAKDNPRVQPVNCSVCQGTCWDRDWAHGSGPNAGGHKCTPMSANISYAKSIGPCHEGCDCVPPSNSYDYTTHDVVPCCKIAKNVKLPDGTPANCDGKKLPTRDKDRGKDYNHSTFIDLIIEGLVGLRAALGSLLLLQPLADKSISYFALDNVAYHGRNVSVLWDPQGDKWPHAGCVGFCVFVDGKLAAKSAALTRLSVDLAGR